MPEHLPVHVHHLPPFLSLQLRCSALLFVVSKRGGSEVQIAAVKSIPPKSRIHLFFLPTAIR